jgi:hypothetical protein
MIEQIAIFSAGAAGVALSLFFVYIAVQGIWNDCVIPMRAKRRYEKEIWFFGAAMLSVSLLALVGTIYMVRGALWG